MDAYRAAGQPGRLALNVKADGLQALVAAALADVRPSAWFTFDMSVPDALVSLRHGLPIFTRHSDVEPEPVLPDAAEGVWLDDFAGGWITEARVAAHLDAGQAGRRSSRPNCTAAITAPRGAPGETGTSGRGTACRCARTIPHEALEALRMIKAVVFDMDGVLIDAREWHYEALNRALGLFGYEITRYDHLSTYDGLPTRMQAARC